MKSIVRKLSALDAPRSAQLHYDGMPEDFLPSFGKPFLAILHGHMIASPHMIPFGFFANDQLEGIIIGTTNTSLSMKQVMRSGALALVPHVLAKLITRPALINKLVQTISYGDDDVETTAELIVLSIDKSMQRIGAGTKLINALKKEFKMRGIKKFKVGTRDNNVAANSFYVHNGGVFINIKKMYGRDWNYYLYTL